MESIRTLLVEDDVEGVDSIQLKLAPAHGDDISVEHRPTLRSALSRVRAGDIDVVLLDLDLPDSAGVDTVARLHEAAPDVPIVAVTDTDDDDVALRSLRASATDCLVRSRTDRAGLRRTVRHALERHRIQADLVRSVRALEKNEARLRNVITSSSDGVVVVSREGAVLFANPSAERLIGRPLDQLQGEMLGYPFAQRALHELSIGSERVIEVHIVECEWDGAPVWLASLVDITSHKRSRADLENATARAQQLNVQLQRLASIDPLTEVLNRRGLAAELSIEVRRKRRSGAPLAAVLLDCDDFKLINETLGYAGGDAVLKELADRLKDSLRPSDHIGRLGGDEFLVLLPDTRFAEAFHVAERLRLSISDLPLRMTSGPVHVAASLGIEMVSADSPTIDDVLVRTQASLQQSKRSGKNRVSTQDRGASRGVFDSDVLVNELQSVRAFRVLRRPILKLADESVVGWELVSRGPAGIFEKPSDFFRLALERNILAQVDLNCLRACIRHAHEQPAMPSCHVHVFPSTVLENSGARIAQLVPPRGLGPQWCIELSEQHVIGEPMLLRDQVRALKQLGLRVGIDDVGFGRSSLETLILLEPDMVKIDPRFVHRAASDSGQERSLRRMVGVVASLGAEIVADGIASRAELELLLDLGVPYGQGALWGGLA